MANITRKPSGLSIKRNSNIFVFSWKIGDKDYGDGQTLQYRLLYSKWTKWTALTVGTGTTQRSLTVDASKLYPHTKRALAKVQFRVR
jgi:hypothetical protein